MQAYGPTNKRLGGGKAITHAVPSPARKARIIRELLSRRKPLTWEGLALCLDVPELGSWETEKPWETMSPTERQLLELSAQGVPLPLIHCKGLASIVLDILAIRKLRGMASLKMVARLYKQGVVGGEQMTSPLASSVLKAFARLKKARPKP